MIEHIEQYRQWWSAETAFVLVTITAVQRSAPLPPGQTMAIGPIHNGEVHSVDDLQVVGSVSGGCVESDILYRAFDMLIEATSSDTARFGFSEETAFAHGLTCGGELEVLLERVDKTHYPGFDTVLTEISAGRTVTIATPIPEDPKLERLIRTRADSRNFGMAPMVEAVSKFDRNKTTVGGASLVKLDGPYEGCAFVRCYAPPPRLIIFGAIDFAAALSRVGRLVGYHVTVCDARATFATSRRFPDVDALVVEWPDRYFDGEVSAGRVDDRTAVCVLTHDLKFDVPLLISASRAEINYIGAMGSRRTHIERTNALAASGQLTTADLDRIHSPIGLDLGGNTAAETAVSIMAEVLSARHGGTGQSLSRISTPIHKVRAALTKVPT
ncbi:XdhC family protein [Rhodococcus sp. IEGM 1366]|uniref:XdhC family protein n=1 Tax=Rhodococcus sp. IEGM 1366 TaxID=3082223 RepID=UPI002954FAFA|nr:XdhC family protein [Rhodococcus sp. IEGM 1366]MDV8070745.1 XdhC family protein [Rhodococcus sp. IEGM 1366]